MKLADFLAEDAIVVELQATDRNGVLREMVQSLADHSHLNPEDVEPIARALIHRTLSTSESGVSSARSLAAAAAWISPPSTARRSIRLSCC
jgi:hypothetical protein